MKSRRYIRHLTAAAAISIAVSGCALPPIVTAISLGADFVSLAGTGKTVTDHGLSFAMQQDCALLRAFDGGVCQDYAPDEDSPEGALLALAPLSDPALDPSTGDPMARPSGLAKLDDALDLAVAAGPAPGRGSQVATFAKLGDEFTGGDDLRYLTAGING